MIQNMNRLKNRSEAEPTTDRYSTKQVQAMAFKLSEASARLYAAANAMQRQGVDAFECDWHRSPANDALALMQFAEATEGVVCGRRNVHPRKVKQATSTTWNVSRAAVGDLGAIASEVAGMAESIEEQLQRFRALGLTTISFPAQYRGPAQAMNALRKFVRLLDRMAADQEYAKARC